jgi:hypothetical protein
MPAGGRRPGAGRKPRSLAVAKDPGAIQSPARAAASLTTAAQYRQTLRDTFQRTITPAKFRRVLDKLFEVATEGKGAEQFRAADLLLRVGMGNPAVHGDSEEGGAAADEAASVRQLMASLPPGYALVHASTPEVPVPAAPGAYVPAEVVEAPPPPAPAAPA